MNLTISETLLQHTTVATHADVAVDILFHATGECALGRVLVARSVDGVCAILIGADHDELQADLAGRFPQATLVANEAAVHDDLAKVIRFVDNPAVGLHLTLDMRGTPLHRRVWEKLRAIPVGRTVTYTELARWISPLTSARVVAGACAANPIALAIPCHRVVRAEGDLKVITGAEPKEEIGGIVDIYMRKMGNPAVLFDDVPGFPKGHRVIANILTSIPRVNLALGLPPETAEMEQIQWWRNYFKTAPSQPTKAVNGGPLLDNVFAGSDVDIEKIPTPVWHEQDGGPYIGTGCLVAMKDPDTGWINYGTYRVQSHEPKHPAQKKPKLTQPGRDMQSVICGEGSRCDCSRRDAL